MPPAQLQLQSTSTTPSTLLFRSEVRQPRDPSPRTHSPHTKRKKNRPHGTISICRCETPIRKGRQLSLRHTPPSRLPTRAILPPWLPPRVCNASARRRRVSWNIFWIFYWILLGWVMIVGWVLANIGLLCYSYRCRPLQGMRILLFPWIYLWSSDWRYEGVRNEWLFGSDMEEGRAKMIFGGRRRRRRSHSLDLYITTWDYFRIDTETFNSKARVLSRSTASPSLWSSLRSSASRYDTQIPRHQIIRIDEELRGETNLTTTGLRARPDRRR